MKRHVEASEGRFAYKGSFDCVTASLRETVTALRMTMESIARTSSNNDVNQLAGDVDSFHDLFAGDSSLYLFVGKCAFHNELLRGVGRHNDAAAQLAVDLHGDFEFFFFRQRGIVPRPRSFEKVPLPAEHFPEFVSEIGSERCQQQNEAALHLGHKSCRGVIAIARGGPASF